MHSFAFDDDFAYSVFHSLLSGHASIIVFRPSSQNARSVVVEVFSWKTGLLWDGLFMPDMRAQGYFTGLIQIACECRMRHAEFKIFREPGEITATVYSEHAIRLDGRDVVARDMDALGREPALVMRWFWKCSGGLPVEEGIIRDRLPSCPRSLAGDAKPNSRSYDLNASSVAAFAQNASAPAAARISTITVASIAPAGEVVIIPGVCDTVQEQVFITLADCGDQWPGGKCTTTGTDASGTGIWTCEDCPE